MWELWRQDDPGNVFLVATFKTQAEADAECARYEAKLHHQHYWVCPSEESCGPRLALQERLTELLCNSRRVTRVRTGSLMDYFDLTQNVELRVEDVRQRNWRLTFLRADVVVDLVQEAKSKVYLPDPGEHFILVDQCTAERLAEAIETFLEHRENTDNG